MTAAVSIANMALHAGSGGTEKDAADEDSRHTVVENTILDKNVIVQEGATVGVNKEHGRARGLVVSSGGVTVVGKGQVVPP